jgi:acyl carrier protein
MASEGPAQPGDPGRKSDGWHPTPSVFALGCGFCFGHLCLLLRRTLSMPSQDEIYSKVSATLVEALNVDEEEIKPTSTLQGDLGAESIDFLDIVFRLEREFGIKIPRGELFPESIFQGDPEFVQDGKVTDKGLAELRARMPFADLSKFEKNPELSTIGDLFTVDMITRYIQGKLNQENGHSNEDDRHQPSNN